MKRKLLTLAGSVLALAVGAGTAAASSDPALVDSQAIGQAAASWQEADASADSTQIEPTNVNVPVRIFSPGDAGDVSQSNSSLAAALAANANETDQDATQSQASDGYGTQAIGQAAESAQDADASADSTQIDPTNANVPVRIFSPGDDGDVEQSNDSTAKALAANANHTDQEASQSQGGGGSGTQSIGQAAKSGQKADASADSTQKGATNVNVPVRIFSPGDDGDVTQSNSSYAGAAALNLNGTDQTATQSQDGAGYGTQAIGQAALNLQGSEATADSTQIDPTNANVPVRIFSPGDDGDVEQSNDSTAKAISANVNSTDQDATQSAGGGTPITVQAIGQLAASLQLADAAAESKQIRPSNANAPVEIFSPGGGGSVSQSNSSAALAVGVNKNETSQNAAQELGGEHALLGVQAVGQLAASAQQTTAYGDSKQIHPTNANTPVEIGGKSHGKDDEKNRGDDDRDYGDDRDPGERWEPSSDGKDPGKEDSQGGSVWQANQSAAWVLALNFNATTQGVKETL
jgi:hypothetical protein